MVYDQQKQRTTTSPGDLLSRFYAYGAMLPFYKTQPYQQQMNLALHNQFSIILLEKYFIFIEGPDRNSAIKILNNKLSLIPSSNVLNEDKYFCREFSKDIANSGWPLNKVKNLIANIIKHSDLTNPTDKSADTIAKLLDEFYLLCIGLLSLDEESKKVMIGKILAQEESMTSEFKQTLMWDVKKGERSREIKKAVAKTIAAFMNSMGGTLLIGVNNDGNPVGLDYDLQNLRDKEGFLRAFSQVVSNGIGKEFDIFISDSDFLLIDGKEIFYVVVEKSSVPVFVTHKGEVEFFIRIRNTSPPLNVKEAINYYKMHWESGINATYTKESDSSGQIPV